MPLLRFSVNCKTKIKGQLSSAIALFFGLLFLFIRKLRGRMKIYRPESIDKKFSIFIQPGRDNPETKDWLAKDGYPKSFHVNFLNGVAEVDSQIGKYLIDKKMAQKSPLILPKGV